MLNGKDLGRAIAQAIQLKLDAGSIKTQADVARHFGIQPPSIADWKNKGSISKDKLPELWRFFSDVVGPEHWGLAAWPHPTTLEPASSTARKIPVRSWLEAGQPVVETRQAQEWVEVSEALLRRHTFALRVEDGSLEPAFSAGTLLVVEPEPDFELNTGDFVIVLEPGNGPATCKQLVRDGDDLYVDHIHSGIPTKPLGEAKIVGIVRQVIKNLR